jgi:KDEL-tailed cysteine endopeptidase
MKNYNMEFSDNDEFLKRLQIFASNIDLIEQHNSQNLSYQLASNQYAHLTYEEFVQQVNLKGIKKPSLRRVSSASITPPPPKESLPASVDWTTTGAVTPVKNQGNCGSCWSFSTTGALEGAYFLKYGKLVSFSEQQLVSCDTAGEDAGCNGGWMDDAFTFVKNNGGITTEDAYPYVSGSDGKSGTCVTSGYTNVAEVAPQSYTDVTPNNVQALMAAVAQQPVSIAIQANQIAFQFYSNGVLTGRCGQNLDHGVLLVGYGTDDSTGLEYWKVKNSWGTSWGEAGYIRIERSEADLCGVLDAPSYPNL